LPSRRRFVLKKLEGRIAEEMKKIIYDGDSIIEIDGKEYYNCI